MTQQKSTLLLAAALVAGMAATADAQQPHPGGGRPAAPAARPAAPHFAPAPRMAAPQMSAPRMSAPHMSAPRMAAPQMAPRMAQPRMQPRVATPHINAQRMATPHIQRSPTVNRTVQQQQYRQERLQQRALRQQQPSAQARSNAQALTKQQTQGQLQTNSREALHTTRDQQRAERALRQSEARELRRLPPSQRAARREQIQQTREQRALARQQQTQPNAAQAQSNARNWRENRRNGMARVTLDAARQGRFAARFARQAGGINASDRWSHVAARNAWRNHHRARFVAWFGPVFWPYAYSDIFDYTFWPSGYDDGYWAYAYDDFFDGVFWGDTGVPDAYAYAAPSGYATSSGGARSARSSAPRPSYASVQELCRQPGNGVTAWPIGDIERKVGLNGEQKQLLDEVRRAGTDAAAAFKASCPADNAFPLTPPGRLDAMTARLDATLQAVQTVRPPLERFYASLNDEQKERFNLLGPQNAGAEAQASVASQAADTCKQPKQGLTNLPIEKIEDALNPTDAQQAELMKLQDATSKAVSIMQTACPDETPMTPPGRLNVMEKRLQSMVDAAKTVKPALENFYGSLSGEQKARFNRIGQQLARTNG
ncbi:MAG: Spy/CpxP family protein refolding chaperone [Pseudolabrys sp.]